MGRYVLGLDGGTGGMRAFVFDANGTPITSPDGPSSSRSNGFRP